MDRVTCGRPLLPALLIAALAGPAVGQINVGSNGSHGAFDAAARDSNSDGIVIVDLATEGNYDPVHWMVVFHFTSVNIQAGKTVRFTNHPSRAPVVWLSQSTIDIRGVLDLNGQGVLTVSWAEGGPGGFRGGRGVLQSAGGWLTGSGFGPGGSFHRQVASSSSGGGASHATVGNSPNNETQYRGPLYGNEGISQLIGGSGGAASRSDGITSSEWGGAGGGGAILLASNDRITVHGNATLRANGGNGDYNGSRNSGNGSGGAIKLIADEILFQPNCFIQAIGGNGGGYLGGSGRIRVEANSYNLQSSSSPPYSLSPMASDLVLNPVGAPEVSVYQVGGLSVPSDPRSSLTSGADLDFGSSGQQSVLIRTRNVPLTSQVFIRVTRAQGAAYDIEVTNPLAFTGGLEMEAETSISIPLDNGITALQARVVLGV